ncbi:MAG TPA: AMP-binding protein [Caulobacteraceae bacterium]|jgi:feruloyl-CoA synthase|nr:AMP-binding protein [Caulobacteraceae bacterium]
MNASHRKNGAESATQAPGPSPIRHARYAQPRHVIDHRADGSVMIDNTAPFPRDFSTTNGPLDHWAKTAPDRLWLAERSGEGWRRISFGEGLEMVAALAGAMAGLEIGPGRPMLILARNGVDHALAAYAAMRLGAPIAPVSPQYGLKGADPARLAHAVALIGPASIFVDDAAAFGEALSWPLLEGLTVIAGANARPGDMPLQALLREGGALPDQARPDSAAKLMLTSGSTGQPKAVICTHDNLACNAAQIAACFDDPDPPVLVHSAPWSHSLGANAILQGTLHRGGGLYIDAGQPVAGRFGETLRNLAEVKTTYQNMVPAAWSLLAGELERDDDLARVFFDQVRVLQYGGAGLAQSVADRIEAVALHTVGEHISFGSGYGATETGPTICNVHWENLKTGLIGMPLPGTSIKLAPQDGRFEIRVKGPQVSPGYHDARRSEGQIAPGSHDEDGYYRLGDAARMVDPERPELGLAFDGRLVENFKLATGAFVNAGALRLAALSAMGGAALDAVVCGEGRAGVGLMLFVDPARRERLGEAVLKAEIEAGLRRMAASASGLGGKIARAMILPGAPDAHSGEITDKGYINQGLARARRPTELERLFADSPEADILVFE